MGRVIGGRALSMIYKDMIKEANINMVDLDHIILCTKLPSEEKLLVLGNFTSTAINTPLIQAHPFNTKLNYSFKEKPQFVVLSKGQFIIEKSQFKEIITITKYINNNNTSLKFLLEERASNELKHSISELIGEIG